MDVNDRNRDTRPSDDGGDEFLRVFESLSNNFSSTSEELNNNTTGLKVNTKSLDNNTRVLQNIARQFDKITSKFGEDLQDAADRNQRSVEDSGDIAQNLTTDMRETFERGSHNINQSMKLGQKVANFLIDSLKIVGGTIIKQYTDAANTVAAKYKESLSSVTVKMQISKGDYSDMFNDISRQLQQEGLNKSFSVVDFTDSLEEVLSTGVRGEEARREAYQNMITNKLLPAISTNTTAYRKMSKTFSDSFNENYLAMEKYTEQLYGAEAIEEGKSGEVLEALESRLRNEVAKGEMTEEDAMRNLTIAQSAASALESMNVSADDLVGLINDFANGMSVASAGTSYYTGLSSTDEYSTKNLIKLITTYFERGGYSSAAGRVTNQALGSVLNDRTSQDLETAVLNGLNIDDILDKAQETIDSTQSTYNKWMEGLKNGDFSTSDQILDKVTENTATSLGVAEAQIARFDEISSDVKTIVGLLGDIIFNQVTGGSGSGLTGRLLGGRVASLSNNIGEAAQLYNLGENFTSISSAYGRGTAALGKVASFGGASSLAGGLTNLAAGPGAIIAGAVMMGKDALEGGFKARDEGASNEEVFLHSLRGAFTGGKIDSEEEKSSKISNALQGKGVDFDWGAVGGNALKGGLVGAGVGTAVGGWAAGLGTVIGGAVGTVGGALASAIDQMIENAKYNKLAEAVSDFSTSLSEADSAISEYQKVTEKSTTIEKNLQILSQDSGAAESNKVRALDSLKQQFPALLGNVSEVTDLTDAQVQSMKDKLEQEKEEAEWKARQSVDEMMEDLKSYDDAASQIGMFSDDRTSDIGSTTQDLLDRMLSDARASEKYLENPEDEQSKQEYNESTKRINQQIQQGAKETGQTEEEYVAYLNRLNNGAFYTQSEDGSWKFADVGKDQLYQYENIQKQFGIYATKYDDEGHNLEVSEEDRRSAEDLVNDEYSKLLEAISEINKMWGSLAIDENGNYVGSQQERKDDQNKLKEFVDSVKSYNSRVRAVGWEDSQIHSDDERFSQASKIAEALGEPFQFKVGAYDIPRDNVPAILHQDEMVLTSANAETLRDLAGGDVSGYLARQPIIDSIEKYLAALPADESSESSTTVASAIETQTESITGVLNNILVFLQSRLGDHHVVSPTTLSDNYLEFLGANH